MGTIEKFLKRIGNWGTVLGAAFLVAIALLVTIAVIFRAMRIGLPGTFDLVETMMVVAISAAILFGQLTDSHVRADIALDRIKGRVRQAIESCNGIIGLFYWVVIAVAAAHVFRIKWQSGENTDLLNVPVIPFRGVWLFITCLMVLLLFFKVIHHIKILIKGEKQE